MREILVIINRMLLSNIGNVFCMGFFEVFDRIYLFYFLLIGERTYFIISLQSYIKKRKLH